MPLQVFPYTPTPEALTFTIQNIELSLDLVNFNGIYRFGVIEKPGPGFGFWMGTSITESGTELFELCSIQGPFPGGTVVNPGTGESFAGNAVELVNQLREQMLVWQKPVINAKLRVRFPTLVPTPTPVPGEPPFSNDLAGDTAALAWIRKKIKVVFQPPVNGQFA